MESTVSNLVHIAIRYTFALIVTALIMATIIVIAGLFGDASIILKEIL